MNRDHAVIIVIASKYCISDSFVDYDVYSISSKGFLPTLVDIWSSDLNSPIPVHLSSLIPRMSMFTLVISCLTTSNLPLFMDLTFQVPMQYCSLQHQTFIMYDFQSKSLCFITNLVFGIKGIKVSCSGLFFRSSFSNEDFQVQYAFFPFNSLCWICRFSQKCKEAHWKLFPFLHYHVD